MLDLVLEWGFSGPMPGLGRGTTTVHGSTHDKSLACCRRTLTPWQTRTVSHSACSYHVFLSVEALGHISKYATI